MLWLLVTSPPRIPSTWRLVLLKTVEVEKWVVSCRNCIIGFRFCLHYTHFDITELHYRPYFRLTSSESKERLLWRPLKPQGKRWVRCSGFLIIQTWFIPNVKCLYNPPYLLSYFFWRTQKELFLRISLDWDCWNPKKAKRIIISIKPTVSYLYYQMYYQMWYIHF